MEAVERLILSNSADRKAAYSASERQRVSISAVAGVGGGGSQPRKYCDFGTTILGVLKKRVGEAKLSNAYAGCVNRVLFKEWRV